MENKIILAEEVAQRLRVSKQRIWELVRTQKIPFIRLGERQYRFSLEAIEQWLEKGGNHTDQNDGFGGR